ncbi:hypothetical protein Tco_1073875 [Tanacetum coccineum]
MDDPNITMEEYIRLEEEKSHRHSKVYNWETATYGRIWYDDDVHDLRSVETKFPTIVFNDKLMYKEAISYETTVSSLDDNKIDFRISFDESDDNDYMSNMSSFSITLAYDQYFDDLDYIKALRKNFPPCLQINALSNGLIVDGLNLLTSLENKSTKLVKYRSSRILCVL